VKRLSEQQGQGIATLSRIGAGDRKAAPKLVIGLIRGELAKALEQHFRAAGWRVCSGDTTAEVRAKAHGGRAAAVVLPAGVCAGESGFLTCAKLKKELPNARVILVGSPEDGSERFAKFAGAVAYLPPTATADELVKLITPASR